MGELGYLPVMYGFAAVSREPSPLPMTKMAIQKPAKDLARMQGNAISAPMPTISQLIEALSHVGGRVRMQHTIQAETPNESSSVAIVAQNPIGVAERSKRIGTR